jgi:DNA-binding LacI/PurR family transcriptional regulator
VTIRDVAAEAGVSITTASRALNQKGELREETRRTVLAAARRLRYVPSEVARALASGKTETFGVVITDNTSPAYAQALQGVESFSNERGYSVLLTNSADSPELSVRCLSTLWARGVDGILFTPIQGGDEQDVMSVQRLGLPFVCLLRYSHQVDTPFIVTDNEVGGHLATSHLLELGRTRIAHIGGRARLSSTDDRLAGYLRALGEWGFPIIRELVSRTPHTIEAGYEAARFLLSKSDRPTAIYAATTHQAVGALRAASELGMRVPDDLALVGGDEVEFAEFLTVPLTTVEQPSFEIGLRGAELLHSLVHGENPDKTNIFLRPQLRIRESTVGLDSTSRPSRGSPG